MDGIGTLVAELITWPVPSYTNRKQRSESMKHNPNHSPVVVLHLQLSRVNCSKERWPLRIKKQASKKINHSGHQ